MLDKQTVLNALEKQRSILDDAGMYGAEHTLVHYAIRVVEELPEINHSGQGPLSVIRYDSATQIGGCPSCGRALSRFMNFCPICGQRVSWPHHL